MTLRTSAATIVGVILPAMLSVTACSDRDRVTGPTTNVPSSIAFTGTVWNIGHTQLEGARVEIIDGHEAGASTVTDRTGWFALSGRFSDVTTVRASMEGYVAATSTFTPGNQNRQIHFVLEPVAGR